jgi:hypothetical protein
MTEPTDDDEMAELRRRNDELERLVFSTEGVWHVRHSDGSTEDIVLSHGNLVEDATGTCGQFILTPAAEVERLRAAAPASEDDEHDITALRQALWDAYEALGFDTDGDRTPAAVHDLRRVVLNAAREFRQDYEAALDEIPAGSPPPTPAPSVTEAALAVAGYRTAEPAPVATGTVYDAVHERNNGEDYVLLVIQVPEAEYADYLGTKVEVREAKP